MSFVIRRRIHALRRSRLLRLTGHYWRMRVVFWGGALTVGVVSIFFAIAANYAQAAFRHILVHPWLALIVTPADFLFSVWLARTVFSGSEGSGISQLIQRESLYHALAHGFIDAMTKQPAQKPELETRPVHPIP